MRGGIMQGLDQVGQPKTIEATADGESRTADLNQRDLLVLLLAEQRRTNEFLALLLLQAAS